MKRALLSIIVSVFILSSCGVSSSIITAPTTPVASVSKKFEAVRIGHGVFVIADKSWSSNKHHMLRIMRYHAAKFTLKKGYRRFVLFSASDNDEEVEKAKKADKVRELYLKRIDEKSTLMNKGVVRTLSNGSRSEISGHAVVVMLRKRAEGFDAQKVLKFKPAIYKF